MLDMQVARLYESAVAHQIDGRNESAMALYQDILNREPGHADANHNLGMIEFSAGSPDRALELLLNAIELRPTEFQFWLSLVEVLLALGQLDHVRGAIMQAEGAGLSEDGLIRLRERLSEAELPAAHKVSVESVAAATPVPEIVDEILAHQVSKQTAHSRRGAAGRRFRALDKKTVQRLIGYFNEGDFAALSKLASRITRENPNHPSGWHFLGVAKMMLGERLDGLNMLIKANQMMPGDPQLLAHLASALTTFGFLREADACFNRSLELRPGHIDTLRNYISLKVSQNDFVGAEALATQALNGHPDDPVALHSMATVYLHTRRNAAALPLLERATEINPKLVSAFQDLGLGYFRQGDLRAAISSSRRALEANPNIASCYSNLLFFVCHDEERTPEEVFQEHVAFGRRFEAPLMEGWRPHNNVPESDRKLRVGFVSADFWDHAVAHFIEPILQNIDTDRFELFGFHSTTKNDHVTERIRQNFKFWVEVPHVSDKDLAEIIRASKIDILVDLSGHTAGNRLLTFARKPAPIQATWIGYPNTTGLQAMDYAFGDRHNAPLGLYDHLYTEKIVRLPSDSPFKFPTNAPEVNALPALTNGFITFASFNRLGKISPRTLDLWAQVMLACPESRMLVGSVDAADAVEKMVREFSQRGIGAERLRFEPRKPTNQYLALHHDVDVILDTFPYNGGTTSGLALWMGVPVLTISGLTRMSNAGAGGMRRFGLEQFVASNPDEFIAIARSLSLDPASLADIRRGMRERLLGLPNREFAYMTRGLEAAFREMWHRWCEGLPAVSFFVPD